MSDTPENDDAPRKPKRFGKAGESSRKPYEVVRRPRPDEGEQRPRENDGERPRTNFSRGERQAGTARSWSGGDRGPPRDRDDRGPPRGRDDRDGNRKTFRDRGDRDRGPPRDRDRGGERPRFGKPRFDKPRDGDRPWSKDGPRHGDRERGDRERGRDERSGGERREDDRRSPPRDRYRGDRPSGDRFRSDRGPPRDRDDRRGGPRPGGRFDRSDRGDRGDRNDRGDRPRFGGKGRGDGGGYRGRGDSDRGGAKRDFDRRGDRKRDFDRRDTRRPREEGEDNREQRDAGARPPGADHLVRVAGLNAVQSLFAASPERIVRLFYTEEQRHHVGDIAKALAEARKPYRLVEADELEKIAATVHHGGVLALAEPPPLPDFDATTAAEWAKAGDALLILDGIGNPHNLGAVARTAAFFGVKRLLLSGHSAQAAPSDAAYRVAQGGLDHIEVFKADDIASALAALKPHYRVVGTALQAETTLADIARDGRTIALVLGNEEEGVPAATLAACDDVVRIPGRGSVQSLNVAATAAILVHALMGS